MKNHVIGLYLRLSDEDDREFQESNSIISQREILKNYVRNHREFADYNIVEFCDDGYSGTNFTRPGVQKMLEQVRAGMISVIMVKDDCVILELNSESPENTGLCDVSSVF